MRLFGCALGLVATLAGCKAQHRAPPGGPAPAQGGALILRVVPTQPAPPLPGRLVLIWAPIGDDDASFQPELGYSAPFPGNQTSVVIPYAAIARPHRFELFPRCFDGRRPECQGPAGVATAYVLVVPERGGPIDARAALRSDVSAVGRVVLGFGTDPIPAGGPLRDVFPAGIAGGMAPYGLGRPPGRSFDQLWLAAPGTPFDLVTCTLANPGCDLPFPNLN